EWIKQLKRKEKGQTPSLLRALIYTFGLQYMLVGIVVFLEVVIYIKFLLLGEGTKVIQPLLLGGLIRYFTPDSTVSKLDAWLYALGVSLCAIVLAISHHPYFFCVQRIGMRMRVACCSLMYKKTVTGKLNRQDKRANIFIFTHLPQIYHIIVLIFPKLSWQGMTGNVEFCLKLSNKALGETTTGQIVNLMSNDVNRFDQAVVFLHFLWVGPLQAIAVLVILWHELGPSVLAGFFVLLLLIPVQGFMGKLFSKLRHKTAIHTDERVKVMNEIISGMRVIKMYCWEKPFGELVEKVRSLEIKEVHSSRRAQACVIAPFFSSMKLVVFCTFTALVVTGNSMTAYRVFLTIGLFQAFRLSTTLFIPFAIQHMAESKVVLSRLEKFLLLEELKEEPNAEKSNLRPKEDACYVELDNVTAKWEGSTSDTNTLENISLSVGPGQLIAVIGPVGAGKSSLLMNILGELPALKGTVKVSGKLAYVSQQPWIFSGSVRQNIVFGGIFDKAKYDRVIKVSALKRDFEIMPQGDATLIGDRGVSLSGGQRARVSLARALYMDADIYLLDDPLSAVDSAVGRHIFEQ
ncbi:unnamed protein product, partial [Candidula unifasciata]